MICHWQHRVVASFVSLVFNFGPRRQFAGSSGHVANGSLIASCCMWRIIARYYKFIWIPLGTQFPEANSFSNTSFLFDRIWLKFEWRLLSVDFFFVLLKFLFFPRVSSYRLTDRTHKGRRQAPTLSDPPLFQTLLLFTPQAEVGWE